MVQLLDDSQAVQRSTVIKMHGVHDACGKKQLHSQLSSVPALCHELCHGVHCCNDTPAAA